jgi:hypothetical protein
VVTPNSDPQHDVDVEHVSRGLRQHTGAGGQFGVGQLLLCGFFFFFFLLASVSTLNPALATVAASTPPNDALSARRRTLDAASVFVMRSNSLLSMLPPS